MYSELHVAKGYYKMQITQNIKGRKANPLLVMLLLGVRYLYLRGSSCKMYVIRFILADIQWEGKVSVWIPSYEIRETILIFLVFCTLCNSLFSLFHTRFTGRMRRLESIHSKKLGIPSLSDMSRNFPLRILRSRRK